MTTPPLQTSAAPPTNSASGPATPRHGIVADLRQIATDFWDFRELLGQLARRDIAIRYKQAVMGFAWALFMPILIVLAGLIVRLALATVGGLEIDRASAGALALKGWTWAFFVGAIGFATASLTANIGLVTKIYFPREVLPMASVAAQAFDSAIAGIALAIALPFLGLQWTTQLLWLPVLLLLLAALTVAASLFLSCANLFFRDVKYIVQVLLTFGIFFTPVLFEPSVLGARGAELVMLNPLAPILEGIRLAAFQGHSLLEPLSEMGRKGAAVVAWQPWYLWYSAAWALGGLALSSLLFHRAEFAFAEYV
jgi:ABC-type polysaccharide/polyol phosphate export permease